METIWKKIEGYPMYEVSSLGIRRIGSKSVMKSQIDIKGYPRVYLRIDGVPRKGGTGFKRAWKRIHLEIAKAFIDNPMNKPQVNHKNGVKTDYSISNLEWVTAKENMVHALDLGLVKCNYGEDVITSKMTLQEVTGIRDLWDSGAFRTKKKLWEKLLVGKVSIGTVYSILNRRSWKHA